MDTKLAAAAHDAAPLRLASNAAQPGMDRSGRPAVLTPGAYLRFVNSAKGRPPPKAKPQVMRSLEPVTTTAGAAPGQAGYVHYFHIKKSDGTLEVQVGLEMPDQRIAWSFPDMGVAVSPFMRSGTVRAGGKRYEIRHLYGIRPFADDAAMQTLQAVMARRIAAWVDDKIPYCESRQPGEDLCVSCLGFVMHILFPGHTPAFPAIPADFPRAGTELHYTTEDLLVYLAGLHTVPTTEARLKRIDKLAIPQAMQEELVRLVQGNDASGNTSTASSGTAKNGAAARPPSKLGQRRTQQRPRQL